MYHTPGGSRVLTGAEKRLFTESLAMMVDLVSDGDFDFGVSIFDGWQRNQKIAALHTIARALLIEDESAPRLTAAVEAAVASVYQFARVMVIQETEEDTTLDARRPSWRELVLAAARQAGLTEELPAAQSRDNEEWEFVMDCLEGEVLWDNDWEAEMGLDVAPADSQRLKERLGIPEDYYVAVPPDPSDEQAERLLEALRRLTPEGR